MLFNDYCVEPVQESLEYAAENYTGEYIEATDHSFAEIMCEHATETAQLESALYVTDVVIESKIVDGLMTEEEAVAVAESAIGDFVKKIREKLAKLWEKVKGWFISLKNNIKVHFATTAKFFKEYENAIREKAKNNKLIVKTYDYDLNKATGLCDDFQSSLLTNLKSLCGALGSCKDVDSWKSAIIRNADIEVKENDNFEDVFWKNCKLGSSYSDVKDKIYEAFHNGDAKEIEASRLPIEDFIKYGKNDKLTRDLDEEFKKVQATYKRSLDDLKTAEAAVSKEKLISSKMTDEQMSTNIGKYVRMVSSKVSTYTALYGNAGQLHIALVEEYVKAGTKVCKTIVSKKAVTESAYGEGEYVSEGSLFDSILGTI
jgi:hypothetical protein